MKKANQLRETTARALLRKIKANESAQALLSHTQGKAFTYATLGSSSIDIDTSGISYDDVYLVTSVLKLYGFTVFVYGTQSFELSWRM